jgi:hypothetical protein
LHRAESCAGICCLLLLSSRWLPGIQVGEWASISQYQPWHPFSSETKFLFSHKRGSDFLAKIIAKTRIFLRKFSGKQRGRENVNVWTIFAKRNFAFSRKWILYPLQIMHRRPRIGLVLHPWALAPVSTLLHINKQNTLPEDPPLPPTSTSFLRRRALYTFLRVANGCLFICRGMD